MDEERDAIAQMRAITVSREYGSGGGEIAARLARRLGWQLIDHEIVVRVAQELGVQETEAEEQDEVGDSLFSRVLASMRLVQPMTPAPTTEPVWIETDGHTYQEALRRVVLGAVAAGPAVIVGRGSQVLLAQRRDVLHLRMVAALERRIAYVMVREGLDQAAAKARIQLKERDRTRYLEVTQHRTPADAHLYDLVVNTDILELDGVVDLVVLALARKARRLTTPADQLGPGAGMGRYAARPEDIRPPENITPDTASG